MNYYLMFDVGGTKIKAGILTETGELLNNQMNSFDSGANRAKDEIFKNFADISNILIDEINDPLKQIAGIGMAFPGPFDYENGISKMTGLNKYDAIYGLDFKKELMGILKNTKALKCFKPDLAFTFIHDVEAFAMGESHFGTALNCHRVMYLCIGTGAGSSFTESGRVLKKQSDNFPENGWIYKTPFKNSIIDDYISVRGLQTISKRFYSEPTEGIVLYERAIRKEEAALNTFREFGDNLAKAMIPYLKTFGPDCLVLGGQISKSFQFFGSQLEEFCQKYNISVRLTEDTSMSILKGLYVQMQSIKNAPGN
ncbi:ROK family protein [Anaerocolumna sp. MB42-C2]|uniref:ROK family protein n=1 Tax=Anaerocolumna sp. MB42-C2 TaxID=3070997 RepID=UPI0027E0A44B|nr:ROK family protein [Anaerocolumna sp. MB42-C2]WMJ85894.1 ROK family protein [Anaerocolumna sp. MB42-C2]